MSIEKFASTEAKVLLKTHAQNIYQWATNETAFFIAPHIKKAVLVTIMRMFELVEGLDEQPPNKKLIKLEDDPSGCLMN